MRPTALALLALLTASCGGDEPDEPQPPASAQPQAADTALDDTMAGADTLVAAEGGADTTVNGVEAAPATGVERDGTRTSATPDQRLYTVQVAAFTEPSSASEWEDRLERQGLPVWTSVAELRGRTFYRLRVGAAPNVAEARRLGEMITSRYEWPVWIAPVEPAERIPEDAVRATRQVIQSS